jgi:O-6-methylguanine DNA methyltransferase
MWHWPPRPAVRWTRRLPGRCSLGVERRKPTLARRATTTSALEHGRSTVNDTRSARGDSTFTRQVLSLVCRIPVGRVASYGAVAAAAGRPRAYRAVGNIMSTCNRPGVPCHRVIAAEGRLGGFGGNLALKRALLASEGVVVTGTRVKDWRSLAWSPAHRTPVRRRGR